MIIGYAGPAPQGRLEREFMSSETRLASKKMVPPVVGILVTTAALLCILSGLTLIYEKEDLLGYVLLISAACLAAGLIISILVARRVNPSR